MADGDVVLQAARSGGVELRVKNPSSIVEGYRVEFERPPPWLSVTVPEIRLLPGDRTSVRIGSTCGRTHRSSPSGCACGCGCARRATSGCTRTSRSRWWYRVWAVPRIGTEPAVVRVKDALRGRFTVHLDNRGANHPRRVTFAGSDDEGVVRFEFDPAVVEVPPDGGAAVQVRVMAPPPAAGERSERSLTVRAIDDGRNSPPSYG